MSSVACPSKVRTPLRQHVARARRARLARRLAEIQHALDQARDRAGVAVVALHEALGGDRVRLVREPARGGIERLAELLLRVEGDAIAAAPGAHVQAGPHAPQERLRRRQLLGLARHQHADLHELPRLADVVARPRRPAREIEIAQAPRAALHVGLEQVERAAVALVPARLLLAQPPDEPAQLRGEEPLERPLDEPLDALRVAADRAQIEERGRRGEIVARERERPLDVHHLVADVEPGVPQRVEQRLGDLLRPRDVAVDDDAYVDVAARREHAAAVAADRREAAVDPLARLQQRRLRAGEQGRHEAVDRLREGAPRLDPGLAGRHAAIEIVAVLHEVLAQARRQVGGERRRAGGRAGAARAGEGRWGRGGAGHSSLAARDAGAGAEALPYDARPGRCPGVQRRNERRVTVAAVAASPRSPPWWSPPPPRRPLPSGSSRPAIPRRGRARLAPTRRPCAVRRAAGPAPSGPYAGRRYPNPPWPSPGRGRRRLCIGSARDAQLAPVRARNAALR